MSLESLAEENRLLQQQLDDYRRLFDSVEVAMIIIDESGTYLDYNKAYYNLMGYTDKDSLVKFHPSDVSPKEQPDGSDSFTKANEMIQIAMEKGKHSFEWMHKRPDGKEFLSYVTLDIIDFDNTQCLRAVIHDISEIKKLERLVEENTRELAIKNKELEHLSSIDPLTGLYNRRKFDAILSYVWDASMRSKKPLGILFLDIDYFKPYNDNYGHLAGDECLKEIAKLIKSIVKRKTDFIARYGGEEFIVVVPDTEYSYIKQLALTIINALNKLKIPHEHSKISSHVTISIGCAITVPGETCHNAEELLEVSDEMLYKAKENGRNRLEVTEF